ncbi:hypothetical protein T190607A02C_160062 [Tenacibaculum sp. 190524A02b]
MVFRFLDQNKRREGVSYRIPLTFEDSDTMQLEFAPEYFTYYDYLLWRIIYKNSSIK